MKGCAVSAILQLLAWCAISAAVMWAAHSVSDVMPRASFAPAAFIGGLLTISIGLVFGAFRTLVRRGRLLRAARGEAPVDGRTEAITGTIHADGEPLRAPMSGTRCVAFRYDVSKHVGGGRHSGLAVFYDGVGVTPSSIRARSGTYKLLAVPTIDAPPERLDGSAARRMAEHVRNATFAEPHVPFTRPQIEKQWSDDDGEYRHERRHVKEEIDLEQCLLTEHVVREGANVCVFGRYSEARKGIVADRNWANETRIMTADAETIARDLVGRARRYLVGALLSGMGAAFLMGSVFLT